MTGDRKALLAAIVADPADDTVRLAYADYIEEEGNSARAEFIRVQIEAERLHPDSNARARLEARAEALFAEHWIEWWGEVCAATGLFCPRRGPKTRLGRAMRRFANFGAEVDNPYTRSGFTVDWSKGAIRGEPRPSASATFRRGFPESVAVSGRVSSYLRSWTEASPFSALTLDEPDLSGWAREANLKHLRSLALRNYDPLYLREVITSASLVSLKELNCGSGGGPIPALAALEAAISIGLLLGEPLMMRLKRLSLPPLTSSVLERVSGALTLTQLEALTTTLTPLEGGTDAADRMARRLSESPALVGLRELDVLAPFDSDACRLLTHGAVWQGLRKLTISDEISFTSLRGTLRNADLPSLEELRLHSIGLTREVIDLLVASPLLKQLKHFAMGAWGVDGVADADLRRLPEMFDLDKLETFRFDPDHQMPGLDVLQEKLGDRLRIG